MALTEERRAALLAYCRIEDPTADDLSVLELLYDGAVGYLENAGVSEPTPGTPRRAQYDLCVNYIVLDGFDQREMQGGAAESPAFRRLLNQLKLSEPYSGTSGEG